MFSLSLSLSPRRLSRIESTFEEEVEKNPRDETRHEAPWLAPLCISSIWNSRLAELRTGEKGRRKKERRWNATLARVPRQRPTFICLPSFSFLIEYVALRFFRVENEKRNWTGLLSFFFLSFFRSILINFWRRGCKYFSTISIYP